MSKLVCIMGYENVGSIERGEISPGYRYSIDKIIVRMSDERRLTRYAVCVNGCWNSNQTLTLKEARAEVAMLKKEATFITESDVREYARIHGKDGAYFLLMLGGCEACSFPYERWCELVKEYKPK